MASTGGRMCVATKCEVSQTVTNSNHMKSNRKKIEGQILASGEHTNHHHRATVDVFEGLNGTREFDGATTITHEEHRAIEIPEGKWASAQVREFDYLSKISRTVRD